MQKLLIGLCIVAALVFTAPALGLLLIFDRPALATGELWRTISNGLVHFSTAHLLLNLGAMAVTAAWAPQRCLREGLLLVLITSLGSSLFIWHALPTMRYFGGLSGIVTAMIVYVNLHAMRASEHRWLHELIIASVILKTSFELLASASLLNTVAANPSFTPVPAVHAIGLSAAFAVYGFKCALEQARSRRALHLTATL